MVSCGWAHGRHSGVGEAYCNLSAPLFYLVRERNHLCIVACLCSTHPHWSCNTVSVNVGKHLQIQCRQHSLPGAFALSQGSLCAAPSGGHLPSPCTLGVDARVFFSLAASHWSVVEPSCPSGHTTCACTAGMLALISTPVGGPCDVVEGASCDFLLIRRPKEQILGGTRNRFAAGSLDKQARPCCQLLCRCAACSNDKHRAPTSQYT